MSDKIHHNGPSSIDLQLLLDYVEGKTDAKTKDKIEQYLKNHAIEKEMVEGIEAYYQEYGPSREEMLSFLEKSQKRTVEKVMERHRQLRNHKKQRFLFSKKLAVAAMIFLAFGIGLYLWLPFSSTEDISVNDYITTPYPVGNLVRSQGQTDSWVESYSQQDFQQASQNLEELLQNHPDSAILHFAAGLSYLYQNPSNPTTAIVHLEPIQDNMIYGEQAKWFLALSYLQNQQQVQAKELLGDIVSNQTYQYQNAQELIRKLEDK